MRVRRGGHFWLERKEGDDASKIGQTTDGEVFFENWMKRSNFPISGFFGRSEIGLWRRQGLSLRQIAEKLRLGLGTVTRTLQARSKSS